MRLSVIVPQPGVEPGYFKYIIIDLLKDVRMCMYYFISIIHPNTTVTSYYDIQPLSIGAVQKIQILHLVVPNIIGFNWLITGLRKIPKNLRNCHLIVYPLVVLLVCLFLHYWLHLIYPWLLL